MTKKGLFLSLILIMLVIVIGVAAVVAIRVVDKAQSEPHATCVLFFNNGVTLHDVPLAETEEQQEKGLSGEDVHFRKMLFRFDPPARVSFWMKDTKVPLSIAFISSEGIIFQMEDMTPDTLNYHTNRKNQNSSRKSSGRNRKSKTQNRQRRTKRQKR